MLKLTVMVLFGAVLLPGPLEGKLHSIQDGRSARNGNLLSSSIRVRFPTLAFLYKTPNASFGICDAGAERCMPKELLEHPHVFGH